MVNTIYRGWNIEISVRGNGRYLAKFTERSGDKVFTIEITNESKDKYQIIKSAELMVDFYWLSIPREDVMWFAKIMEGKLKENDHKSGWENCSKQYLFESIISEIKELSEALKVDDLDGAIKECADISNFAMMMATVLRNEGGKNEQIWKE